MEEEIGIHGYATCTPGIGGQIKAVPEDFRVEEVPGELPLREDGPFLVARATVRNWETNRLVRQLSRALGIGRRRIGFAGTKDKRGITTQLLTLQGVEAEALARVRLRDVTLEPLGRSVRRLRLGDLGGNRFTVRIRELAVPPSQAEARLGALQKELEALGGFPNWFGPQRFGEQRPISHEVGRALVRGDLEGAVLTYVAAVHPGENPEVRAARHRFQETRDTGEALRAFPVHLGFERALLHHLHTHPGDSGGALRQLPHNLLTLLVHAYQSFLFNRVLSLRLAEGLPLRDPLPGDLVLPPDRRGLPWREHPVEVTEANLEKARRQAREGKAWVSGPLVGTEVPLAQGPMGRIERRVLEEEAARPEDFAVPALPRLGSRGLRRELLAPVRDFASRVEGGEVVLAFTLNPGCYATVLLREVRKAEDSA